jgi:Protein of unknown function (DUF2695)
MPNKDEKARRKEMLHSLRDQERLKTRDGLPAPISALKGLFDFLDEQLSESDCDDTLRFTREHVRQSGVDENSVVEWLKKHGGHCDCEALSNVEEAVADAVPGYERIQNENDTVN